MKISKVWFAILVLFAAIGVIICSPALLPILMVLGAVLLLLSPIYVIVLKSKNKKLTIEIRKHNSK